MPSAAAILAAAGSPAVRACLARALTSPRHRVVPAGTARSVREHLDGGKVALVVLALDLPDDAGFALARELTGGPALVLLVEQHGVVARLLASGICADDHVVTPFNPAELRVRCDAALHRRRFWDAAAPRCDVLAFAGWQLDLAARRLSDHSGRDVYLTPAEFGLLAALARRPGWVLSRGQLLDAVAGRDASPTDRTTDVLVARLRRKIEEDAKAPRLILTVPRVGYKLALGRGDGTATLHAPGTPRPSVVVLPFAGLGGDAGSEHVADCITDDIATDLSRLIRGSVVGRSTAFTYKNKPADVRQIGRELGVRYALTGSVRRSGSRLRINAQLADTESGAHIWAERLDADVADVAGMQDAIIRQITHTLSLELIVAEGHRAERRPHRDAVDYAARGWAAHHRAQSLEATHEARCLFERALELDGRSVTAMAGFGTTLVAAMVDGWSADPAADQRSAEAVLLRVLDAEPNHAAALGATGMLRCIQGRPDEAAHLLQTALSFEPGNPCNAYQLALALMFSGQPARALPHIKAAVRASPRETSLASQHWAMGACRLLLGRTDEAVACLRKARALNPALSYVHFWLAGAYGLQSDLPKAGEALQKAMELRAEYRSVASYVAMPMMRYPAYVPIRDRTLIAGLLRAGLPDR